MARIILFFATVIVPFLPSFMKGLATYAAVSLGFSLVAYTGLSVAFDTFKDYLQANMDGLPTKAAQLMAIAGADVFVNVILTCLVFSFTLNGLMAANGYRPSWRKPVDPS